MWLDSLKADGTTSPYLDSASNRIWTSVSYDLSSILPPHVLNEMAEAKRYKFWLESIAWRNRDELTTEPFLIKVDVGADNVFDTASGANANALALLRDNYEARVGGEEAPLETSNKGWLYSRNLKISFSKNDGSKLYENDFHTGVPALTSYVASIIIVYE